MAPGIQHLQKLVAWSFGELSARGRLVATTRGSLTRAGGGQAASNEYCAAFPRPAVKGGPAAQLLQSNSNHM